MADDRIITVPLRITRITPRTKRANRAISEIRSHIARHMKADQSQIWIDTAVNEAVWQRGIQKPPRRITVRAIKLEDGLVEVSLPVETE
ncbi:MAG: 50S ribosomal protein L31e [Thermoplasmatales archaeon]|nr:50S ribosomal protein L31e [Thermoplasmatales archaeon]